MTTALMPAESTTADPTSAATDFVGELQSEWTKIRSVRSTIWALVALITVTISFATLFNWLTVSQWDAMADSQRQAVTLDPAGQILGSGFQFSQLAICILGVLIMTGEYTSGTIRATLLAVPATKVPPVRLVVRPAPASVAAHLARPARLVPRAERSPSRARSARRHAMPPSSVGRPLYRGLPRPIGRDRFRCS